MIELTAILHTVGIWIPGTTHKNVKIYILQKSDLVPGWSIAYLTANPHSYSGDLNTGQVPNSVEKANGWNLHGIDFSISRKIGVVCYYKGRKWFELQAYELAIWKLDERRPFKYQTKIAWFSNGGERKWDVHLKNILQCYLYTINLGYFWNGLDFGP